MSDWNPELYLRFADERTRPAIELLSRVRHPAIAALSDLGCGPGNSTELLYQAWPQADITGVDTSAAMLRQARQRLPACRFHQQDIAGWRPDKPQDLIYANASLQWLTDHDRLLPHLVGKLAARGVLAVQMPDNLDQPTHRLMRQTADEGPWREKIGATDSVRPALLSAGDYYDLLTGQGCEVDIWRTTYYHVLDDAQAIVDWLHATGLRPFLAPLDEQERQEFLRRYHRHLQQAYPARRDGRCLLAFPRLFMVARRR
ncbi:trans-aconitate 2-methyltransferase [Affinibrenneria salicis]|uniref:Trans-aconitate 2-methyltransferase n=1 Tax=Affinibrenneria salicis TaxID=2590031 RepID=A0A5J5FYW3_9GAMM|nr:trans-aconitate 2-methyltransferase [Affinibrenneria salicis]KAA8999412.1 trans-aconitate 2-methyltransferase [Affinibrenneria salicis]